MNDYKICKFCGQRFFRADHKINFIRMICCGSRDCIKQYDKERPSHYNSEAYKKYYSENRERLLFEAKQDRSKPEVIERTKKRNKEKWLNNKKELSVRNKEDYIKNREERLTYAKKYRELHKQEIKIKKAKYQKEHWKEIYAKHKAYVANNKESFISYWTNYHKEKRHNDIEYKLRCNLAQRMRTVLKSKRKSDVTMTLIGCSTQQLKEHLQSQFKPGMTWDNYGTDGWHVDHIIPCAHFDLSNPDEQRRAFHYSNLQPLWKYENLSKGRKFVECEALINVGGEKVGC